jgi:hypothetical protein
VVPYGWVPAGPDSVGASFSSCPQVALTLSDLTNVIRSGRSAATASKLISGPLSTRGVAPLSFACAHGPTPCGQAWNQSRMPAGTTPMASSASASAQPSETTAAGAASTVVVPNWWVTPAGKLPPPAGAELLPLPAGSPSPSSPHAASRPAAAAPTAPRSSPRRERWWPVMRDLLISK